MKRLTLAAALLLGTCAAQSSGQGINRDNPYTTLVRDAKQVIVHVPRLGDGNLVNALKVAHNLGVPMRVITTDDGLMQQNGFVLTLIVLNLPVYQIPSGGDRRSFIEIEGASGWTAYDVSEGRPVRRAVSEYVTFNSWYSANAPRLRRYVPDAAVAVWAQAYLGYKLSAGGIRFDSTTPQPPLKSPPPR